MEAVARAPGLRRTGPAATLVALVALGCAAAGPGAGGPDRSDAAGTRDPSPDAGARPAPVVQPDAPARAAVIGPQDSTCLATVGQRMLEAVNRVRVEHSLPPLRPHPELVAAARAHADDQAAQGTVSHIGADGSAASERVSRAGYRWATTGENVAAGYDDPVDVVMAWLESPPHRAVILEPEAVHAGVGFTQASEEGYRWFWTLTVAAPAEAEDTPAARCHP